MDWIVKINDFINGIVWGVPILVLIFATGIYFTVRLGFIQFCNPGFLFRNTIKKAFRENDKKKVAEGELTSFQAAMTSVAAIVGSGNIAGVATAIVIGGPGALFWMIIAAFIGMASKYAEIALGIKYREFNSDGSVCGGAMYYLAKGLKQKWLGILFSVLVIPFSFVISGIVDSNTIALTFNDYFGVPTVVTGLVLSVSVAVIVFGGSKRIGHACAVIAPFMGGAYVLAGLSIIIINLTQVPGAIFQILKCAFSPASVTGGAVGTVFLTIKSGVARGMYSNEAGLGTAAMVHCGAKVSHPGEQAVWGPVEVFLDTVVVCTITGLAIVISGLWKEGLDGASLTVAAFNSLIPFRIGYVISVASVFLFGFSCLISYYNYAEQSAEFIFGEKAKSVIKILWVIAVFIGSQTTLGFVWDLADTFNGLMIIPNLIGILILGGEVVEIKNEYMKVVGDN